MFATFHAQYSPSPVHVLNSRASSTGDRCSVSILGGTVDVHVSIVSLVEQSHSETSVHSEGRNHSDSPLLAVTTMVSTPFGTVCGSPSDITIPPSLIHLGWEVVPSACMEALLLCSISRHQDFQKRSLDSQQLLEDRPQIAYTTTVGFTSLTGPGNKVLIQLVLLSSSDSHFSLLSPQTVKGSQLRYDITVLQRLFQKGIWALS